MIKKLLAKKLTLYFLFLITILVFFVYNIKFFKLSQENRAISGILLRSDCECRKETILVNKFGETYEIRVQNILNSKQIEKTYNIKKKELESYTFTCDLFSTFRRGLNQKVLSVSLFGKERLYYDYLNSIIESAKRLYPGWTIRVYHDESIDKSIICEKQCFRDKNDSLFDNIDFCNINQIPYNDLTSTWNGDYMLPMTWRWLPLGDDFVDYFISRDTDSCLLDREVAAVNEWLESNNIFHIMRGKYLYIKQ